MTHSRLYFIRERRAALPKETYDPDRGREVPAYLCPGRFEATKKIIRKIGAPREFSFQSRGGKLYPEAFEIYSAHPVEEENRVEEVVRNYLRNHHL